jgi:hypothetical protein
VAPQGASRQMATDCGPNQAVLDVSLMLELSIVATNRAVTTRRVGGRCDVGKWVILPVPAAAEPHRRRCGCAQSLTFVSAARSSRVGQPKKITLSAAHTLGECAQRLRADSRSKLTAGGPCERRKRTSPGTRSAQVAGWLTFVSTARSPEVASTRSDVLRAAGTSSKSAQRLRTLIW